VNLIWGNRAASRTWEQRADRRAGSAGAMVPLR
jgi:hypothetical protein